ncbi:hypothetical protein ACQ5SO_03950 [Rhodovulum sp. DZ06]|uniref:hypothetical protein n=1 Tax=Rhodovulum sp. DZ06 TaxID=3425126 RepID=UPI003D32736E
MPRPDAPARLPAPCGAPRGAPRGAPCDAPLRAPRRAPLCPRGPGALAAPLLSAALLCAAPPPAARAQEAPAPAVTRIEIGQSGVARYTLSAPGVSGDRLAFQVPEDAAHDVLASLVVRDPAGGVVDLQTDTPGARGEALRGSPFSGGLPGDAEDLLRALSGEEVTLADEDRSVAGRVLSVARRTVVEDGVELSLPVALLLADGMAVEVPIRPGLRITFPEAAAAKLEAGLLAGRVDAGRRRFDLRLSDGAARAVELSYVTEATAWKNSWRLLLDEGRLQGWAVLENVSGEDWEGVALTLTTGAPVAYRRDLLDPLRVARQDPPSDAPVQVLAKADRTRLQSMGLSAGFSAAAPAPMAVEADMARAELSGAAQAGQAFSEGGALRYAMPVPVTLPAGRTANLLYLDLPIAPEIRGLHQPARRGGPPVLLAASITSDQALTSGLVSVQDARGFVGDAPFAGMPAGQTRLLPYAAALGAEVRTEVEVTFGYANLALAGDRLALDQDELIRTAYTAELPEGVDLFTVDHPRRGRLVDTNGEVDPRDDLRRITVAASDGAAELWVTERAGSRRTIPFGAAQLSNLVAEIDAGRAEAPEEIAATLRDAAGLAERVERLEADARRAQDRYAALGTEQARLRENLRSVTQGALRERYLAALDRTETEIAGVLKAVDDARAEQERLRGAFRDLLR